jgi:ABC-type antimicrobial peptide transport system permease subunit
MLVEHVREVLLIMWAMTGLVMIVACLNFANLLMARGTARQQELAVRASLGGRRSRLVRQLVIEALVLVAIGGALGLWLAHVGARLLTAAIPQHFLGGAAAGIDARVLMFAALLSTVCGVLFAGLPALRLSAGVQRAGVGNLLSLGGQRSLPVAMRRTHALLASMQIALTLALLDIFSK